MFNKMLNSLHICSKYISIHLKYCDIFWNGFCSSSVHFCCSNSFLLVSILPFKLANVQGNVQQLEERISKQILGVKGQRQNCFILQPCLKKKRQNIVTYQPHSATLTYSDKLLKIIPTKLVNTQYFTISHIPVQKDTLG